MKTKRVTNRSEKEDQDAEIRKFFNMKCEICIETVKFETYANARKHYRRVHKMKGYLKCCGRKFFRPSLIRDHIQYHNNPDEYRCGQCDRRFKTKEALKMHIECHVLRAVKCQLCSSSFQNERRLKSHVHQTHTSKTGEKFPCDQCSKK